MNILVVGGTSGIGRELWKQYVEQGHVVAVSGRRVDLLDEMKKSFPHTTKVYEYDICKTDSTGGFLDSVLKDLDRIDLAFVCAGTGEINEDLSIDKELPTLYTNVIGWTSMVASLYNLFLEQKSGHLVTITSVGGMVPEPSAPAYSSSKAFQISYTRSLQKKSRGTNVLVTEIRPGLVDTAMAKGEGLFWVMPVEKVARQIISAVSRKKKYAVVTKRWRFVAWAARLMS